MPLLARTVTTPLFIDVRRGAIAELGRILADRRISGGGQVAVVVGPGQGERIAELLRPSLGGDEPRARRHRFAGEHPRPRAGRGSYGVHIPIATTSSPRSRTASS